MNINYDIDRLNQIIADFYQITGISITILDRNFLEVTKCAVKRQEFCKTLQANGLKNTCMESDNNLLSQCTATKKTAFYVCYAGLLDAAMPIVVQGEIVGYILMGQVRRSSNFSDISNRLPEGLIPTLEKHFHNLPLYNDKQMESALRIVSAVITKIMEDKMIVITLEELSSLAEEYIEGNLDKKLSIEDLCHYLNVSKNRLYQCFSQRFNCTVNEYIIRKKIEKAQRLLQDTTISIDMIAEKVGFSESSYFYKVFKKVTGKTPNEYRKTS